MMNKLTLKMKLGVGFGTLLAITLVVAGISYRSLGHLDEITDVAVNHLEKKSLANAIDSDVKEQLAEVRGFLLSGEKDTISGFEQLKKDFAEHMDQVAKLLATEEGRKLHANIRDAEGRYVSILDKEIELSRRGRTKEAVALASSPQTQEVKKELASAVADFQALSDKLQTKALEEQNAVVASTKTTMLILVVVAMIVGVLVAVFLTRSITYSVSRMVALIQEIAANNLAVEDMQITSQDEIGKAGTALNGMKNNLRDMIQSIAGTAEHVASASEEISSSATQQAQGAETQKDQTTQVATAMQEMSSTVLQVSENSNKAAEAAKQASDTAKHGGQIVDDTLGKMRTIATSVSATAKKMEELGKSSDQIGHIIGVIDDIADQTNLLALNAAIEAARAGEQGRGFAVVADEVRKLAERTTTATKEIAQMIKNIQDETKTAVTAMEAGTKQVEEGVKSTAQAGDSLKEIIQMSEQVGDMITHIATAATEQSSATEQVNGNVSQIAKLVQESAVGAQQSAKACQDLSGLALDLQKMVGNFKLASNGSGFQGSGHRGGKQHHAVREKPAASPAGGEAQARAFAAGAN